MNQSPQLDKPGAGVPLWEKLYFRFWLLPKMKRKMAWSQVLERFYSDTVKILKLCERFSEPELSKQVLVARLPGLEDSSRFWSLVMTVEHLNITVKGMSSIAQTLASGRLPHEEVDIAKLKPGPALTPKETLRQFETNCKQAKEALALIDPRASKLTWVHPWFGPFTAEKWGFLLMFHHRLHRNQMELIAKGLGSKVAHQA